MQEEKLTQSDIVVLKKAVDTIGEEMEKPTFDFASFNSALNNAYRQGSYVTPQMVNANLQNINLNPRLSTYQDYLTAMQNPKISEDVLISYCQNEYMTNMLYKRNFDYYANLLSFDLEILPPIGLSSTDYNSKIFKNDWSRVEEFLSKFDYRTEFKKCVFNMLNSDVYPCMLRMDLNEDKYVLQDFSYRRIKITGRSSHGLLADADLSFLTNGTEDIRMYPKWVAKKWRELFKNNKYIPSSGLNSRDGSFAFYVQTDPSELWVFKFNPDFITQIPYFAPMILDTGLTNFYRELQMNQSLIATRKIITAQWPLLDSNTSQQADRLAVSTDTMGGILGGIKAGLGEYFNIVAIPSEKIEFEQPENLNKDTYQDFLKNISGLLGGANTLFSVQKQSAVESMISADLDTMLMTKIYPQFENFLSYYVGRITKKYKFGFRFKGTNCYLDRDRRYKQAMDLAKVGIVSANKIGSSIGMNIFELERELDMTKARGFTDKLMPMLNLFTMGKDSGETSGGRPQKENSELSQAGQETRSDGSNIEKGGKI